LTYFQLFACFGANETASNFVAVPAHCSRFKLRFREFNAGLYTLHTKYPSNCGPTIDLQFFLEEDIFKGGFIAGELSAFMKLLKGVFIFIN
jgi:hypothetical protein